MSNNIANIKFKNTKNRPIIDSDTCAFALPFYKNGEYFSNIDNFVSFIKAVEKQVRGDNFYKKYISYLKNDIGLTRCQVLSNIDDESAEIELHHGPILTLFDCACIITDYYLAKNKKINTFIISNTLLEEHKNNNIQVVMLSKSVHQQVHDNNIFINLKQAFGNLVTFLNKYRTGIHPEQIQKINKYIELSEKYESFDKNVLELKKNIKSWSNDEIIF